MTEREMINSVKVLYKQDIQLKSEGSPIPYVSDI